MYTLSILLCAACLAADPTPASVCVTELWEIYDYDYDYPDEGGSYAELTVWAWNVELKSELPNGMTGWTYVGYLQLARILHYDDEREEQAAWWCTGAGKTGAASTAEDGLHQMLKCFGCPADYKVTWK